MPHNPLKFSKNIYMTKNSTGRPFFDLVDLIRPTDYTAAAETEDELGCVLRMHLCLERFLDEFLEKFIPNEHNKYHTKRQQQFSGKLSLAVAYGLSKPISESIYIINQLRNKFAHKSGSSISSIETEKIADLVDEIKILGQKIPPVRTMWIELTLVRPGEKLGFGEHSLRIDFVIVCSELLKRASGWIVLEYVRRNPHLIINYTQFPQANISKFRYRLPTNAT